MGLYPHGLSGILNKNLTVGLTVPSPGYVMSKVLEVLDIIDKHDFERVDNSHNFESLFSKIFAHSTQGKDTGDVSTCVL